MRKLFTAITFGAGALFGMIFSTKKGDEIRTKVAAKKSTEDKAEVVGEEAKEMFKNFWATIKGPLKKGLDDTRKEMEKAGKKYGKQAQKKMMEFKDMAEEEIQKEVKKAKKEINKAGKKLKATAKKKAASAKKTATKKATTAKKTVKKKLKG